MLLHLLFGGPAEILYTIVLFIVIEVDDVSMLGALFWKKRLRNQSVQKQSHVPTFGFKLQRGIPPHEGTFKQVTVLDTGGVADQPPFIGDGVIAAEDSLAEIDHFPLFVCDGFYHVMGVGWGLKID